jgi:hypothetical protein
MPYSTNRLVVLPSDVSRIGGDNTNIDTINIEHNSLFAPKAKEGDTTKGGDSFMLPPINNSRGYDP